MRKAFQRRGWAENEFSQSNVYDLRWDLNDNNVDFDEIRPGQLCNHFPNNQELTTKTGLARNLQRLTGADMERFFPRCYDFTEERGLAEFTQNFERTAVMNLVKKHAEFFERIHAR